MVGGVGGGRAILPPTRFGISAPFLSMLENLALGHSIHDVQCSTETVGESRCELRVWNLLEDRPRQNVNIWIGPRMERSTCIKRPRKLRVKAAIKGILKSCPQLKVKNSVNLLTTPDSALRKGIKAVAESEIVLSTELEEDIVQLREL